MELGTSGFTVFLAHMKATVVNGKGNAGKSRMDISRSDPIGRVLGVVVVAVHGKAIRAEEVIAAPVMVYVFSTHIVAADGIRKAVGVGHFKFVRVGAVARGIDIVSTVKGKHNLYLLASIGEVAQAVIFPLGYANLRFHAG